MSKFLSLLIIFFIPISLCSASQKFKIAILDNFTSTRFESSPFNDYQIEYDRGLELAKERAETMGIHLEYAYFLYGDSPLAILDKVNEIKTWSPDFIIGPRASNYFLMLKDYFHDTLVLSPLATSTKIDDMPRNFQSMTLPAKYMGIAMYETYKKYLKNYNVFALTNISCKNCIDETEAFEKIFNAENAEALFIRKNIMPSSITSLSLDKNLADIRKKTMFLLPDESNISFILAIKIFEHLASDVILMGGDDWGDTIADKMALNAGESVNFTAYRLTFWPFIYDTPDKRWFIDAYFKKYHAKPSYAISYVNYKLIMSVFDACKNHSHHEEDRKQFVLDSYLKVLDKNPFEYKSTQYGLYLTNHDGTRLISVGELHEST